MKFSIVFAALALAGSSLAFPGHQQNWNGTALPPPFPSGTGAPYPSGTGVAYPSGTGAVYPSGWKA